MGEASKDDDLVSQESALVAISFLLHVFDFTFAPLCDGLDVEFIN